MLKATMVAALFVVACNPTQAERAVAEHPAPAPPAADPIIKDHEVTPPEDSVKPDVTWFKGAKHLPAHHPCHNNARVLVFGDTPSADPDSIKTLGQLRRNPDESWSHFGARTVRGATWTDESGDHMVVTCDLRGMGFRPAEPDDLKRTGSAAQAVFRLGDCCECNGVSQTYTHWMTRPTASKSWQVNQAISRSSNEDEGNDPNHFARSRILSVDVDLNGPASALTVTAGDCRRFHQEKCPAIDSETFVAIVVRREGSDERRSTLYFTDGGRLVDASGEPRKKSELTADELAGLSQALEYLDEVMLD